ncbi:hypothetical protein GCK72_020498 [Caenorhabditis remanei]|uniref:Sulfotransferase domain-containing protein n=1 Tax=Caenorhabditis remanei TaxID=31234 RepID=A0A6A5GH52_CAERE|nr:hypothetical protein GCK72_020498 [Caenorhabditis remanei]KAF1753941.1 hypothetical protein GCK72_020498 [Caenorhabditis remanei]
MGSPAPKYFWIVVTFSVSLSVYGYFYFQSHYTVYVDGHAVNFPGVEDFIQPFISYFPETFAVPDKKLISCGIPKSMSQLTINIMCLLYDEDSFRAEHNSLSDNWLNTTHRYCLDKSEFRKPTPQLLNDNETARFVFIRDPIHRFVSLYLEKCFGTDLYCFDCDGNMRCFIQIMYDELKKIQNYRHEFQKSPVVPIVQHAAPLSWNCKFDQDLKKWHLLMIGSDFEERKSSISHLTNILRRQGINESLVEKIQNDSLVGETPHSTHTSPRRVEAERQVREDPFIRDLLHKMYFFDYLIFPFKRDGLDEKYRTNFWTIPK